MSSRTPFLIAIGSFFDLTNTDILYRYSAFYEIFLDSHDISAAMDGLYNTNNVNPEDQKKYSKIDSFNLFVKVYKGYLENECSPKAVERRKNETFPVFLKSQKIKLVSRKIRRFFENHFRLLLLKTKNKEYIDAKNRFFMIDKYPENNNRFPLPSSASEFERKYKGLL